MFYVSVLLNPQGRINLKHKLEEYLMNQPVVATDAITGKSEWKQEPMVGKLSVQ